VKHLTAFLLASLLSARALADVTALVVVEPTQRKDAMLVSRDALQNHLSKVLGEAVTVTTSEDMTDAMRATRSGGYDVFIAPPQVAASALAHGYSLVGVTDSDEQYLLVGRSKVATVGDLRGTQIYLPQQDSIYTYLARGMLKRRPLLESAKSQAGPCLEHPQRAGPLHLQATRQLELRHSQHRFGNDGLDHDTELLRDWCCSGRQPIAQLCLGAGLLEEGVDSDVRKPPLQPLRAREIA